MANGNGIQRVDEFDPVIDLISLRNKVSRRLLRTDSIKESIRLLGVVDDISRRIREKEVEHGKVPDSNRKDIKC